MSEEAKSGSSKLLIVVIAVLGIVLVVLFFAILFGWSTVSSSISEVESSIVSTLGSLSNSLSALETYMSSGFQSITLQTTHLLGQAAVLLGTFGQEIFNELTTVGSTIYSWVSQQFSAGFKAIE